METFIEMFDTAWPWVGTVLLTGMMLVALLLWGCLCAAMEPREGPNWLGEHEDPRWEDEDGRLHAPMNREGRPHAD